ncbi:MAG: aminotransferase [Clostridiales bacterium]|nr:aminotransferase [Clostridiales bacterium]
MYDFETLVPRRKMGSAKWAEMEKVNPSVGEDIVPFSVADMEFKNPPEIMEGLKKYLDEVILGYTIPTDEYYDAVIGWMKRKHNWNIDRSSIVLAPGIVSALFTAVRTFLKPSHGVILLTPVYYPFFMAASVNQCNVVESPLKFNGIQYDVDYDDLKQKAKDPANKMLLLCNPHNPVGRVWTKEELMRIGRICIDNDVLIIADEIHFDLIMPGFKHTVFASISEEFAQHSITCTAPSKTFNLAGMQTSNIIISNSEIREKFTEGNKNIASMSLNTLGYKACELAYNKCEKWLDELLEVIEGNRKYFVKFMKENIPEIKPIRMEGTYLQWFDCRGLGMTYKELENFMTQDAMFFLDEGYIFGQAGEGFERINLACPRHVLEKALLSFKKCLDKKLRK